MELNDQKGCVSDRNDTQCAYYNRTPLCMEGLFRLVLSTPVGSTEWSFNIFNIFFLNVKETFF